MTTWGVEYKKQKGCALNCHVLGSKKDIALVQSRIVYIDDVSSMVELIDTVKHETGCKKLIIFKDNFSEEFFKLSTKLMAEIIAKCEAYEVKVAVT